MTPLLDTQDMYDEAKQCLKSICEELQTEGQHQTARSLMEGMEETLTLHRLNVDKELRQSLRTTNIVEHLNNQVNGVLRRIKRWLNSDQCHQWVTMTLKQIQYTNQLSALLQPRCNKYKHIRLSLPLVGYETPSSN